MVDAHHRHVSAIVGKLARRPVGRAGKGSGLPNGDRGQHHLLALTVGRVGARLVQEARRAPAVDPCGSRIGAKLAVFNTALKNHNPRARLGTTNGKADSADSDI